MNVGFSYIGTPEGFEHSSFGIAKEIKISWKVDLDNRSINIHPETEILMIKREVEGNDFFTYITLYRFAYEMENTRSGSFYGSALVLKNCVPNGSPGLIKFLNELAGYLKKSRINEYKRFSAPIYDLNLHLDYNDCRSYLGKLLKKSSPATSDLKAKCFFKFDENSNNSYENLLKQIFGTKLFDRFGVIYTSQDELVFKEVLNRELQVETLASLVAALDQKRLEKGAHLALPPKPSDELVAQEKRSTPDKMIPKPADNPTFRENQIDENQIEKDDETIREKDLKNFDEFDDERQFPDADDDFRENIGKEINKSDNNGTEKLSGLAKNIPEKFSKKKLLTVLTVFAAILITALVAYLLFSNRINPQGVDKESDSQGTIYYIGCKKADTEQESTAAKNNCEFKDANLLAGYLANQCRLSGDGFLDAKDKLKKSINKNNKIVEDSVFSNDKPIIIELPKGYDCSDVLTRNDFRGDKPEDEKQKDLGSQNGQTTSNQSSALHGTNPAHDESENNNRQNQQSSASNRRTTAANSSNNRPITLPDQNLNTSATGAATTVTTIGSDQSNNSNNQTNPNQGNSNQPAQKKEENKNVTRRGKDGNVSN